MAIDGTFSAQVAVNDRRSVGLNTSVNIPVNVTPSVSFTDGAGANQANVLWQATRTFSGSTDDLDLNGVLSDSYGSSVAMVRVKGIYVKNNSASNNVTVGNATSNQWATFLNSTGTLTLPPGAFTVSATPNAAGWTVTASTGDILRIGGTSGQTYDIAILGASS